MKNMIDLAMEGPYAAPTSCFPIGSGKDNRAKYLSQKHVYVAMTPIGERIVAAVHLCRQRSTTKRGMFRRPGKVRALWMDVITGTLYQFRTGMSLSSEDLFLWDIHKDQSKVDALVKKRFAHA